MAKVLSWCWTYILELAILFSFASLIYLVLSTAFDSAKIEERKETERERQAAQDLGQAIMSSGFSIVGVDQRIRLMWVKSEAGDAACRFDRDGRLTTCTRMELN